jgi:EAL domain-containing protein (putative c-di-GMP-specific phosphodiesterase class I)
MGLVGDGSIDELKRILGSRDVRSVYQPVVDLASGDVVAYEALARGPAGSALERPDALFDAARRAGLTAALDEVCVGAAIAGALEAGLRRSAALFINVEPAALSRLPSEGLSDQLDQARAGLDVVVEVTERALVADPAALLRAVAGFRSLGWGIALDDVGAETASLALMPFLAPDVIKLDLRLVQDRPDAEIATIVGAVAAQAERTGARVLAEGIETERHLQTALGMGATLAQGWLLGRPGPLRIDPSRCERLPLREAPTAPKPSTMAAARAARPVRRATKPLLMEMSRHLERQALLQGEAVVVLGAFQTADRFTPATSQRYAELARTGALVAAVGIEMPDEPAPGVRGATLTVDDPLVAEWSVAVVGPHFAAALVAVDLGDTGADTDRRFDHVLTYDREVVLDVATVLLSRIDPAPRDLLSRSA